MLRGAVEDVGGLVEVAELGEHAGQLALLLGGQPGEGQAQAGGPLSPRPGSPRRRWAPTRLVSMRDSTARLPTGWRKRGENGRPGPNNRV